MRCWCPLARSPAGSHYCWPVAAWWSPSSQLRLWATPRDRWSIRCRADGGSRGCAADHWLSALWSESACKRSLVHKRHNTLTFILLPLKPWQIDPLTSIDPRTLTVLKQDSFYLRPQTLLNFNPLSSVSEHGQKAVTLGNVGCWLLSVDNININILCFSRIIHKALWSSDPFLTHVSLHQFQTTQTVPFKLR